MRQIPLKQANIRYSSSQHIDNGRRLRCWRCNRRLFDYNEAVYEFLRLMANNALMRGISDDGKIEVIRTRCGKCNAYNSLTLYLNEARPPRARDLPVVMDGAH